MSTNAYLPLGRLHAEWPKLVDQACHGDLGAFPGRQQGVGGKDEDVDPFADLEKEERRVGGAIHHYFIQAGRNLRIR